MTFTERPFLAPAFALSLILHALLATAVAQLIAPALPAGKSLPARLTVLLLDRIAVPDAPAAPAARLLLPQTPPRHANAAARARVSPEVLSGAAARSAAGQLARDLPYPAEAIERGLQGEVLVLLFLDESGNAIAARVEASSGHALLDDAAVLAARSLRALPGSAPREALLPVRFRLR